MYCPWKYLVLIIAAGGIFFLSGNAEEVETFRLKWELRNVVKKSDTPLGALYKFDESNLYSCIYQEDGVRNRHRLTCDCTVCKRKFTGLKGIVQANFLKKNQKNKRFVVLDFRIRTFPAWSSKKTNRFEFQIVRSRRDEISSNYLDLNGISDISSQGYPFHKTTYQLTTNDLLWATSGKRYRPAFQPLNMRIIYDTVTGNNVTVVHNQESITQLWFELPPGPSEPIEIRTLGIISQSGGSARAVRQEYFEISDPTIYQFDSPSTLKQLPPMRFSPYPYDSYFQTIYEPDSFSDRKIRRKIEQSSNPDLQYACALRLLYGAEEECNPADALKLLERAAKEHHVLALYELGVCYYRGYGVDANWKKAIDYLKEAEAFNDTPATVLHAQILWRHAYRPLYLADSLRREIGKMLKRPYTFYEDHDYNALLGAFCNSGAIIPYEVSPKRISLMQLDAELVRPHPSRPGELQKFSDYALGKGYIPAYLTKSRIEWMTAGRVVTSRVLEYLEAGARHGDLECMTEAIRWRAAAGKLTANDFTAKKELLLADDPVWSLCRFVFANPGLPGIGEFLAENESVAREIWQKRNNVTGEFLLGLSGWMGNYPAGRKHDEPPMFWDAAEKKRRRETFEHLKNAARHGFADAQYLVGRQYFREDLPEGISASPIQNRVQARNFLTAAADGGHLRAACLLAELEMQESSIDGGRLLKLLEPACALDDGPAFLLRGSVLARMNRSEEARTAWEKATVCGEYRAFRDLALAAEQRKQSAEANKLWSKFIQADRAHRTQDRYDVFYPTREYGGWYYPNIPEPVDQEREELLKERKVQQSQGETLEEKRRREQKERRRERAKKQLSRVTIDL